MCVPTPGGVPALDDARVARLAFFGIEITPIIPLGANVKGVDFKKKDLPEEARELLEKEMATRGFLVFKNQGVLSGDEQVSASELWGGRKIHSTHGVHPRAPNEHIFRLSNDRTHGILGVGPQWHNDGSFLPAIFSHVGYHIIEVPDKGSGATFFSHQGAAFDHLTEEEQERWSRLVSVNSNGGVLHPVVHTHPISGRKSIYLHLGMTGAILEVKPEQPKGENLRLLDENEMQTFFNRYNDILNAGLEADYSLPYNYEQGDMVMIDNLAISHRASPEAHDSTFRQGLRILHRSTVKGMIQFAPPFGLPPVLDIEGENPLGRNSSGVWQGGGTGFVWKEGLRLQN